MSAALVLSALRACLARHGLEGERTLVAAVSGGADSMALLCALHRLRGSMHFTLHACHVQHGLRGEASLGDQLFVEDWCRRLDVPLSVTTAQLGGDPSLPGMETRARECRRSIFAAEMERLGGAALLTAHHQGDQTETVLMHLLRGAGAAGLSGMAESVPFAGGLLLRPFLQLPRSALLAALEEWGVPHREDATNQQAITLRNALRLQVLPLLESLSPGSSAHIAQSAALLRRDEAALAAMAEAQLAVGSLQRPGLHALCTHALSRLPGAVAVRTLRLWYEAGLTRMGLAPDERTLSALDSDRLLSLADAPPGQPLNLPCGLQAQKGQRWLHLLLQDGRPLCPAPAQEPMPLPLLSAGDQPALLPLPGWGEPMLTLYPPKPAPAAPPSDACTVYLPEALLPGCTLRLPQAGDRIHPLGASGSKPLRRWLTDRKLDAPFRPLVPVLAQGSTIHWIPGLCTAQSLAHTPGMRCLRLVLQPLPPYLPTTAAKET